MLFEKPRNGMPMGGFTENYIRVETNANEALVNKSVMVRLGGFNKDKSALVVDEVLNIK